VSKSLVVRIFLSKNCYT